MREYSFPDDKVGLLKPLTREQLLNALEQYAYTAHIDPCPRYGNLIQFGLVGFPNVGKSSVINVLIRSSSISHDLPRVGVASQPGKTKHFQTLRVPDWDVMLCDCPGLVFPSFLSSTADLIVSGVYSIAHIRDPLPVIEKICQRISRDILDKMYSIHLPHPPLWDIQLESNSKMSGVNFPFTTAKDLLDMYCHKRSVICSGSGAPDYHRASRVIAKDFVEGRLLYCHSPPLKIWKVEEEERYNYETRMSAIMNTEKLRNKLRLVPNNSVSSVNTFENLVKGVNTDGKVMKSKYIKKHKRKGHKIRNFDPYGCHPHSNVNEDTNSISSLTWRNGLSVQSGKYGRRNYTRPNYTGARAAFQFNAH